MSESERAGTEAPEAAKRLVAHLGRPRLGVVLGSGFAPVAAALGEPAASLAFDDVPGLVAPSVDGHVGRIASFALVAGTVWIFGGRLHLYEGHSASRVSQSVRTLAWAGAEGVLLTCASGGLLGTDAPGTFAVVEDHLNLTGSDPARKSGASPGEPHFVDLHETYDPAIRALWERVARRHGVPMRRAILAGVRGPSYETPAEVRMLRALGADAVTMSTVVEAMAARDSGLRVAALACVANAGSGLAAGPIRHRDVLDAVASAVAGRLAFLRDGILGMLESLAERSPLRAAHRESRP